jgi:hypothetical protein
MKVTEVIVTENKVVSKSTDRVVEITKNKKGINVLHFKAPTSKVGKEPAVKSYLSEDELIKNSLIGISDEAVLDLTFALNQYAKEVLGFISLEM